MSASCEHERPAGNRDVIVIGGSAGSLRPLQILMGALPTDLPAAVLVALHQHRDSPGRLGEILDAAGPLPAAMAEEGQPLEHGRIYVAPPDRHLLVGTGQVHVRRGPRENSSRPAIDPLFRSAAAECSTRVIGVVLSGMLDDGAAGLWAIKQCGGVTVVQDPLDAAYPEMPRSALDHVEVDHVVPAGKIAPALVRLSRAPRSPPVEVPEQIRLEALIAGEELFVMPDQQRLGSLTSLTCPECDGSLQEIREGTLVRYRCHTGHGFTLDTLQKAGLEAWERTLYGGFRTQQQQAMVARRLAEVARQRGQIRSAEEFDRRAQDYEEGAMVIRQLIARDGGARSGAAAEQIVR